MGHGSYIDGARPPKIKVFVSRSSLARMRRVYSVLGDKVVVEPLRFSESELDAESILSMMAVGSMSDSAPLYMQRILVSRTYMFSPECERHTDNSTQSILRDLGESFTYKRFLREVDKAKKDMSSMQTPPLDQRMVLLKAYVDAYADPAMTRFKAGQLTVVDLSDPFVDPTVACALFEIVTRLFVRADVNTGKVLVVDEAHKVGGFVCTPFIVCSLHYWYFSQYLSLNRGMTGLTKALTSLIRQQRHLAMRVIISTQGDHASPGSMMSFRN